MHIKFLISYDHATFPLITDHRSLNIVLLVVVFVSISISCVELYSYIINIIELEDVWRIESWVEY